LYDKPYEPLDLLIERGTHPRSLQGYRRRIQTLDVVLEGMKEGAHDLFWSSNGVESTIGRVEGSRIFELHKNISKSFQKPTLNLDFFARLKKNCSPTAPYLNFQSLRMEKST